MPVRQQYCLRSKTEPRSNFEHHRLKKNTSIAEVEEDAEPQSEQDLDAMLLDRPGEREPGLFVLPSIPRLQVVT